MAIRTAAATSAEDARRARPRPYPIVSADSHVNHGSEVFGTLPEELHEHAPRFEERDGYLWYVTENGPPYPSLPRPREPPQRRSRTRPAHP